LRAPDNRARAAAGLFVYAYMGFSVPTIASGMLADRFGLLAATTAFAIMLVTVTLAVAWKSAMGLGRSKETAEEPAFEAMQAESAKPN
jgi:hypothetical protein